MLHSSCLPPTVRDAVWSAFSEETLQKCKFYVCFKCHQTLSQSQMITQFTTRFLESFSIGTTVKSEETYANKSLTGFSLNSIYLNAFTSQSGCPGQSKNSLSSFKQKAAQGKITTLFICQTWIVDSSIPSSTWQSSINHCTGSDLWHASIKLSTRRVCSGSEECRKQSGSIQEESRVHVDVGLTHICSAGTTQTHFRLVYHHTFPKTDFPLMQYVHLSSCLLGINMRWLSTSLHTYREETEWQETQSYVTSDKKGVLWHSSPYHPSAGLPLMSVLLCTDCLS